MVKAKFMVTRIERSMGRVWDKEQNGYKQTEVQTLILIPVVGTEGENAAFFAATPSGEIRLATVNAAAASEFDLGREFYVDFTVAS